ncbi:hypothetical protein L1267_14330 [Pseudoalteromonas sp. OFAV1]|uniref:hypothetical protein n=1 Tax=Pseudoalteromonas sp. OFAV1 TaxID=2908892 RepID=UPI001F2B4A3A|nr:hypothetical protein [Pseudoalteromonas sp. OFAV1]MCF2901554.1 hypothetical protein [Pseudoalteromonas sp. OFAV1]
MSTKNTLTTNIDELTELTKDTRVVLNNRGIDVLADVSDVNFMELISDLEEEQQKSFYEIVYKANVNFFFEKTSAVSDLPVLSKRNKDKLVKKGYSSLGDFNGVYYPDIYELIGFNPAKEILVIILASKTEVCFEQPNWGEDEWKSFVLHLIDFGLITWEDVAINMCSELNPPQVGTAVAEQVKPNYPPRQAMKHVFKWFYEQSGKCEVSGKRLWLEADHKVPKEHFIRQGKDPKEANTLDNFQLLTKRENVIKRGSHRLGGLSFAQASAVLVYVLLRYKPKNIEDFGKLCRNYGLTMAAIRFQEAWALAIWLSKEGLYEIDSMESNED